jgi:5-hydroxyisourate hydrolase
MSRITTHVLDTSLGKPAAGLRVTLGRREGGVFNQLGQAVTDADGRVREFSPASSDPLRTGIYRLSFETTAHFRASGREAFFTRVELEFSVSDAGQPVHVPLLITPFGYTTYRGS